MLKKICDICGILRPISNFPKVLSNKLSRDTTCLTCINRQAVKKTRLDYENTINTLKKAAGRLE